MFPRQKAKFQVLQFFSLCPEGGFAVVQSLSWIWLFATPWTAAHTAPLSSTMSWSLLRFMSIGLAMPSNHLILCHPFLLPPSILPSIQVCSNESALCIRWASTRDSASASALPMNIWGWCPLGLTGLISCSPRDSQESSPTSQFESINSLVLSLLYGLTVTSVDDYWATV